MKRVRLAARLELVGEVVAIFARSEPSGAGGLVRVYEEFYRRVRFGRGWVLSLDEVVTFGRPLVTMGEADRGFDTLGYRRASEWAPVGDSELLLSAVLSVVERAEVYEPGAPDWCD